MKPLAPIFLTIGLSTIAAQASLWVDFNSTNQDFGPHNNTGYQAFSRGHEVAGDLGPAGDRDEVYATTFAGTPNVTLTIDWTNTTDIRVRQSIDRASGNDATWSDTDLDLVTDFIGIDARSSSGGNGDWDGTTGTPTNMNISLSGLPANTYKKITVKVRKTFMC